jgi:antitoxin component of RelBE/YafQ-DinJ toxin-antitoxin module
MKRPSYIRKDGKRVGKGLPKAQKGLRKPIYVEDPNDPRLRSYQDSLATYNLSRKIENIFNENPADPRLEDYNRQAAALSRRTGIKPVTIRGSLGWTQPFRENLGPIEDMYMAKYKKPVQPVKYKKKEEQQRTREYTDPIEYQKALQAYTDSTSLYNSTNRLVNQINKINQDYAAGKIDKNTLGSELDRIGQLQATNRKVRNTNPLYDLNGQLIGYSPVSNLPRRSDYIQPIHQTTLNTPGQYFPTQPWAIYGYKKPVVKPVFSPFVKQEEPAKGNVEKIKQDTIQKSKQDVTPQWLKKYHGDYMRFQADPNFETYIDYNSPWLGPQYYVKEKKKIGGQLPIAQTGLREPIFVEDPNDPRLRAYNDSLNLYRLSNRLARSNYRFAPNYSFPSNPKYGEDYLVEYSPTGIMERFGVLEPIGVDKWRDEVLKSLSRRIKPLGYTYGDVAIPVYKKPSKKVKLKKAEVKEEPKVNVEVVAEKYAEPKLIPLEISKEELLNKKAARIEKEAPDNFRELTKYYDSDDKLLGVKTFYTKQNRVSLAATPEFMSTKKTGGTIRYKKKDGSDIYMMKKGGGLPKAQVGTEQQPIELDEVTVSPRPIYPTQFLSPKVREVMANQKPQPQLGRSRKTEEQAKAEEARGRYIENPTLMDYVGQAGYIPYAFLHDPFSMGETLKEARRISSDPNLDAYGRVTKGLDEIINPTLPQTFTNLAIGEGIGGLASGAIKRAIPAPQMMSNLFRNLPEKVVYSNAKYNFPKYPLKSAETQTGIDPVHYRAVEHVKSNMPKTKIPKSHLVNPQFGHDYILPEGIDVNKLNEFARKIHKGEIEPQQINDVYESIIKLNPELQNVNVPKADLIHGVASHIAPQDLMDIQKAVPLGFADPSKGFLKNLIRSYNEAKWQQFSNRVDPLGQEGLDFRFSPQRQKEIMKSFKPTNPYKPDLDFIPRNPEFGAPLGTAEDLAKFEKIKKAGRGNPFVIYKNPELGIPENLYSDLVNPEEYSTSISAEELKNLLNRQGGYSDIPQFNEQLKQIKATMQFGKRPLLSRADFVGSREEQLADRLLIEDSKNWDIDFSSGKPELISRTGDGVKDIMERAAEQGLDPDDILKRVLIRLANKRGLPLQEPMYFNPANPKASTRAVIYSNPDYAQTFGKQFKETGPLGGRLPSEENAVLMNQIRRYEDMLRQFPDYPGLQDKISKYYQMLMKNYSEKGARPYTGIEALQSIQPNKKGGQFPKYQTDGEVNTLEADLITKVLMNRNKDKDFIQRAYALGQNPGMFTLPDSEEFGQYMSHKMAWGDDDNGQAYMFPTILNPNNEAIKVPNQYADYISSIGYKKEAGLPYELNTPEEWEKEIRAVEQRIGDPKKWTQQNYEELQNKLNEYKNWRENTPKGRAVIDYHNEPNEYVVFPPAHLNKEKYNMKRALELGYEPNEEGHWPSVDYESGEYLKSKKHDTAWMEYLYGYIMNPDQALNYNVVVNPEGYFGENQLQYVPKKAKGGPIVTTEGFKMGPPPQGSFYRIPSDTLYNPTDYRIEAVANTGERKVLEPNTGDTTFKGAKYVDEYMMRKGGQLPKYQTDGEYIPFEDLPKDPVERVKWYKQHGYWDKFAPKKEKPAQELKPENRPQPKAKKLETNQTINRTIKENVTLSPVATYSSARPVGPKQKGEPSRLYEFIQSVEDEGLWNALSQVGNYFEQKTSDVEEGVVPKRSTVVIDKPVKKLKKESSLPQIQILSDTIPDRLDNDKIYVGMSINANKNKFDYRNRLDSKDIKTKAGIAHTYNPFRSFDAYITQKDPDGYPMPIYEKNFEKGRPNSYEDNVIAINKNTGNLSVGIAKNFNNDYVLSRTLPPKIISDIYVGPEGKRNPNLNNKKTITLITPENNKISGQIAFGDTGFEMGGRGYNGGTILISTPDKKHTQFIYGSANDLKDQLNKFKSTYKTNKVLYYDLDQKAFSQAVQSKSGIIKGSKLREMDNTNSSGGHLIYLKENDQNLMKKGGAVKPKISYIRKDGRTVHK